MLKLCSIITSIGFNVDPLDIFAECEGYCVELVMWFLTLFHSIIINY